MDGRFAKQLDFFNRRAIQNQRGYRTCAIYVLVVSVMIAPLIALDDRLSGWGRLLAAVLSPTLAIAAGLSAHYRFHENWLRYRATWDAMQQEVELREAGLGDYCRSADRNSQFVENIEALIAREGSAWMRTHASRGTGRTA
jgi:hypothetical protein